MLQLFSKIVLMLLAVPLIFLGFYGSVIGFDRCDPLSYNQKSLKEFPLGDLANIAVDSKGNIYCGLHFYSCIQVYNPKGYFLYSIGIDSVGGDFSIKIDENDFLYVATIRNDKVFVFKDGELVEEETNYAKYAEYASLYSQRKALDKENNIYRIGPFSFLFPYIIKISHNRDFSILIKPTFRSWLVTGPFPALLFMAIGMLIQLGVIKNFLTISDEK
jgi:hypothetical protein